jgi:hypothetical protein
VPLTVACQNGRLRGEPAQVLDKHDGQVRRLLLHLGQFSAIHVATGERDAENAGKRRCFTFRLILATADEGCLDGKSVAGFGVGV